MIASVLTKTNRPLSQTAVEDYIIAIFQGCYNIPVVIYGFMYKPDVGIYTFGPREELQKWQVSGRSDIEDFDDVVKLDLQYIDNWSLGLDIRILIKTVGVVIFGRGAN